MYCPTPQKMFDAELRKIDRWLAGDDKLVYRRREIQYVAGERRGQTTTPERTAITTYTPAAANRLRRYIDNYYTDFQAMVTLTYPAVYPTDGREVKRHLNTFFEALRRTGWMAEHSLVWWLEFQSRGAPHIHMVATGPIVMQWVAQTWARITRGDERACSRVEWLINSDAAGAYAAKYASKSDQKTVPEGYENVGRFWGRRGRRPESGSSVPKFSTAVGKRGAESGIRALLRAWAHAQAQARAHNSHAHAREGVILPGWDMVLLSIRVYEHDGGYSIYGKYLDIAYLWDYFGELKNGA